MTVLILHRTDPACNMRRFYLLDMQPDLFGQWSFIREWDRTGQLSPLAGLLKVALEIHAFMKNAHD
jgi:predicted DNA-binding WGR domain protein